MQSTLCKMPNSMNHKLESSARRNINNFRYVDNTTLTAESEGELKSLLMEVKECKSWLETKKKKKKSKIMVYSHIAAWQIAGETVEAVTEFIFLGSKITADSDCSHEIKRHLLLGRKSVTSLDSILKTRNVTLPTKTHICKAFIFPVVMYGCESWTRKKTEHQRINAFKLWCYRRFLRVPCISRRSN